MFMLAVNARVGGGCRLLPAQHRSPRSNTLHDQFLKGALALRRAELVTFGSAMCS